jgi:hypothetical protein
MLGNFDDWVENVVGGKYQYIVDSKVGAHKIKNEDLNLGKFF